MYCVYLTIYYGDKLPKRYIGSASIVRILSGYNGSVKSKVYGDIFRSEQKNNKTLFKTRILKRFDTRKEALDYEKQLQLNYNVHKDNNYMNMSIANVDGCFGRDVSGDKHPMYGKTHTDECKTRISDTLKFKYESGELISPFKHLDVNGSKNGFYGKTHTEESKYKMRKPKSIVRRFICPHCYKRYDAGNLTLHMKRNGFTSIEIQKVKDVDSSNG